MLIFVSNVMLLKMMSLISLKEIESTSHVFMRSTKLMLSLLMNLIFLIKLNITSPLQVILDGILMSWLKKCGNIWISLEYTQSQKEKIRITMLLSFYQESTPESKISVIKFTETWSRTLDMPWSGVVQSSSTLRK